MPSATPLVARTSAHLVVDLYDLFDLDLLHLLGGRAVARRRVRGSCTRCALHDQVRRRLPSSAPPSARDYWLGYPWNALGRVNPLRTPPTPRCAI